MNEDILKGEWTELKGSIQKQWGKLTDNDLSQINGDRTKLAGSLQKIYGLAREDAEKQLKDWEGKRAA